jgi:penicillin amidase
MPRISGPVLVVLVAALSILPARAATVPLTRDRWGVAHIFVPPQSGSRIAQLRALAFGLGYAHAQDRMFQLELYRRAARGRSAELSPQYFAGPAALTADIAHRRDGLTDDERRAAIRRLPGRLRIILEFYARGVNRYLDEVRADPGKAPLEFGVIPPVEPWDATDTAALAEGARISYEFGGSELGNAATLLDLRDRFPETEAEGIFSDLYWLEDPTAPTTIDPAEQSIAPSRITAFAPRQLALLTQHAAAVRAAAAQLDQEQQGLGGPSPTSNAMVVGGALTASGAPILLGGPQTGLNLPGTFYQIGLHGGGYDAEILMGANGSALGRTAHAAWTITSTIADSADTFVEELNQANPRQYLFQGAYRDMDCRTETFVVYGQPSQTCEFCRTVHGPVFASFPDDGVAFSRRFYTFGRELQGSLATLALGFARDLPSTARALNALTTSLNVLYADDGDNIAYFARGVRPRRSPDFDPRLPLPGTGEAEPRGMLTGRRMPTVVNPARGFLAQWNNKPIRGWSTDELRELWGRADRVQVLIDQIEAARAAGHAITPDDVSGYMRVAATTDFFAPRVFPYLRAAVAALPEATPDRSRLVAAVDLIEQWLDAGATLLADAGGTIPYPGLALYDAWRVQVQADTFEDELGSHTHVPYYFQHSTDGGNQDDHGGLFSPDALFLRALDGPAAAFPVGRDYFANVANGTNPGRDATLVGALRTALGTLSAGFGTSDMLAWLTPEITVQFFATSAAQVLYGPTVVEREDRGSVNLLVELGTPPSARVIAPPGTSGFIPQNFVEPPHLRDQVALYEAFGYRPMPFAATELERPTTTQFVPLP